MTGLLLAGLGLLVIGRLVWQITALEGEHEAEAERQRKLISRYEEIMLGTFSADPSDDHDFERGDELWRCGTCGMTVRLRSFNDEFWWVQVEARWEEFRAPSVARVVSNPWGVGRSWHTITPGSDVRRVALGDAFVIRRAHEAISHP